MKKVFNLNGYLFGCARKVFRWWPARTEALRRQWREVKGKDHFYECEGCNNWFVKSLVQVDHTRPVVDPETGFKSFDEYYQRLFCSASELQVLCKTGCHAIKTKEENKVRRQVKKEKKK